MNKAVFAGTFDPFTIGHLDLLQRSAQLFDKVIVAVVGNSSQKKCVATAQQRAEIVRKSVVKIKNVSVEIFDGLLTDFAQKEGAGYLIRGVRNSVDFEYEKILYAQYKAICPTIEVFYLIANSNFAHVSSSFVKELIGLKGDYSSYISSEALSLVKEIYD